MIRAIYIGDRFYWDSGTSMSSLVRITFDLDGRMRGHRFDWGDVTQALKRGEEVHIRPATASELRKAEETLEAMRAEP